MEYYKWLIYRIVWYNAQDGACSWICQSTYLLVPFQYRFPGEAIIVCDEQHMRAVHPALVSGQVREQNHGLQGVLDQEPQLFSVSRRPQPLHQIIDIFAHSRVATMRVLYGFVPCHNRIHDDLAVSNRLLNER